MQSIRNKDCEDYFLKIKSEFWLSRKSDMCECSTSTLYKFISISIHN